jgi:hypothetical protein
VAIAAGVALSGASFLLAEKADDAYDRYLREVDPDAIQEHYDDAVRYDRFASASLLAGQAAIVLGLYWRLLHRPKPSRTGATPGAPDLDVAEAAGVRPAEIVPPVVPRAALIAEPLPLRVGVRVRF